MSNLRAGAVVGMLALAACGGGGGGAADAGVDEQPIDAKEYLDAPPPTFDWSCEANKTPPTSPVAATATLSGTVLAVTIAGGGADIAALADADVTACHNGTACTTAPQKDGTDTSDAQGAWSIGPITTGGAPVDDYLQMTATGYRTTYAYPDSPFLGDQGMIPMLTFGTDGTTTTALNFFGCDPGQAIIGLALVDCAMQPVTDSGSVMITLKQGGTAVAGTNVIDASQFDAMAAGTFLVCGVPADPTTEVSATYLTHSFVAHNVKTVAGETTSTLLVPGY